jgi:hypothetical protein
MRASFSRIPEQWFTPTLDSAPPRVEQLVRKRLEIARLGLAEARRFLGEGRGPDADVVLSKVDEDLALLRRRLRTEAEAVSPPS